MPDELFSLHSINLPQPCTDFILAVLVTVSAYSQTTPDPYTWTPVVPALATARADACAASLPDGSALVSRVTLDGSALSTVELFQPGIGFSSAPSMNTARAAHSCTTLNDGRVLVTGGNDGHGNPVGTAEIYDPGSQSWTIAADLNDSRWGHTATLLNNGRVLIAGLSVAFIAGGDSHRTLIYKWSSFRQRFPHAQVQEAVHEVKRCMR